MGNDTMKAVIFKGPLKVAIEDRPIPKIKDPSDMIVKVRYTALCGRYEYARTNRYRVLTLAVNCMSFVDTSLLAPTSSWVTVSRL